MSKASRETLLRQGEKELNDAGLGGSATVEALRAASGRSAAADLAIAERLGAIVAPASVEALQALEAATRDKLVQREIKRSLYRLQQRGLSLPEAPPAPRPLLAAAPMFEGYVSAVDGRGDQLVWLIRVRPHGVDQLVAVLNDPEGMKETFLGETTRKSLRASIEELRDRHDIHMVEADWHYCDFLMERGFRWASEQQHRVTGDFRGLRSHILREPAASDLPPLIYRYLDPAEARSDAAALASSVALLDEKELRTWMFTPEDLASYLDELKRLKDSPLVLNELQQRDRFTETIDRAVEEVFGGSHQASWVRRLKEMAYYFHASQRPQRAREALATALALEASTRGGREIPFCEVLMRTCLVAYWQLTQEEEKKQAEGSLIVTPAQIAREAQRRPR
jgi:hypothetical protein